MKNYKITVAYDGTRYRGWQIQKNTDATIQGKLSMVLGNLAGHPVEVTGSGRTDAGVHAIGQVANFHLEEHYTTEEIFTYLKMICRNMLCALIRMTGMNQTQLMSH